MLPKLPSSLLCALALLVVAAPVRLSAQKTINIPTDKPTIQAGIDAASAGDTVLIAPGTYYENIDFKGKAITVTGFVVYGGAPQVTLDGSSQGPAVTFDSGETNASVLSHLKIQNGGSFALGPPGFIPATGSIYISSSAPSILSNTITQSLCFGIDSEASAPLIQGNEISATAGIGCYAAGGTGLVLNGDQVLQNGGTAVAHVIGNTIENNVESGEDISDYDGSGGGAGISVSGSSVIENNTIRNNATAGAGGGISVNSATGLTIVQNLIYGNSSACGGGGISLPATDAASSIQVLISNNTIVDNTGPITSPNAACSDSAQIFPSPSERPSGPNIVIVDNILAGTAQPGDGTGSTPAVDCSSLTAPSEDLQPIFDHNILYNAGGKFFGAFCIDTSAKYGNLVADPRFMDQAGGNFLLASDSPAIDAGNTSAVQLVQQISGLDLTEDFQGNARIQQGGTSTPYPVIDIGAYEFNRSNVELPPTTIVLTTTAGSAGSGYTLTATVKSPTGTPAGNVTFFLDGSSFGSSTAANGVATLPHVSLSAGVHALYATFAPSGANFNPATSVVNIVDVNLITTNVLLTYAPNNPALAVPVTFKITTSAVDGSNPSPVTLTDLTTKTAFTPLTQVSPGVYTYTTSTLSEGPHQVQAAYAGTAEYSEASDTVLVQVGGNPTTTTLSCGTATIVDLGATIPLSATVTSIDGTPTGTVTFTQKAQTLNTAALVNGSAGYDYTVQTAGYNTFVANYIPAAGSNFAASSGSCEVEVQPLALTSSNNPAPAYTPITFTVTLTASPIPAGAFSLAIGSAAPVMMTPNAAGTVATYTTTGLTPGTYKVTATFAPSSGSSSFSVSITQIVSAAIGDFTLTGPASLSTRTEGTISGTLNLTSLQGFQGTVSLTCSLPQPTTYGCTLAPTSVALAVNGAGSLTVALAPRVTHAAATHSTGASRIILASLFPLTLLSLAGFRRGKGRRSLLALSVLAVVAASTTACGTDVFYAATQPGSYPFTVTASGTTLGSTTSTTHTLNITLVLTQ